MATTADNMRHRVLYGRGDIDDRLVGSDRFPDIQNRVTDLQRVIDLGTRKAFGAVLKRKVTLRLVGQRFQKLGAIDRDVEDLLLALAEDLLALRDGGGVVYMIEAFRAGA